MNRTDENDQPSRRFADEANRKPQSTLGELVQFLLHNKRWWLTPIVAMLLLVGALVILSGTVAAPFIYPLF